MKIKNGFIEYDTMIGMQEKQFTGMVNTSLLYIYMYIYSSLDEKQSRSVLESFCSSERGYVFVIIKYMMYSLDYLWFLDKK